MVENMALKAVSVIVLYLLASCTAKQNCSEIQCKLLPVREDVASEFQSIKNSGNNVRMIYLKLKIGNDSYDPLELQDEFLPDRWVWAATIGELMLSLSYDYDILSLGLLKRQVRRMDVQLEDEPSGCLAGLNSSCQNIVVGKALLGNVTTRDGCGKHLSEDVVCVAEIDTSFNFYDNFFDGDVEFRCCKVFKQGSLPKCELGVHKSIWFKAFYAVVNILTVFVGVYSPALIFLLPDYIFDVRKECEKEQQQEAEEDDEEKQRQLQQNGYESIPSTQEMELQETIAEENNNANDTVRQPTTLTDGNNVNANEPNSNEPNSTEPNSNEPNSNVPNSNNPLANSIRRPNSSEPNSIGPNLSESNEPITASTTNEEELDEETRKVDEIPLDDGSPFNISTLLYTCKSAEVFQGYSTKLSFNTKLAFLWFCVIPVFFYTELALGYTLKDEYFHEIAKKDTAFLVGGLFSFFNMTDYYNRIILIISYFVIPFIIILTLRPKDLNEEREVLAIVHSSGETQFELRNETQRVYIGEQVLDRFKKNRELVVRIFPLAKRPIIVYKKVQNVCDDYIKIKSPRRLRVFWVLLKTLFCSVGAVICSVIAAALCLVLILLWSTVVLVFCSPYSIILLYFRYKLIRRPRLCAILFIVFLASIIGFVLSSVLDQPQMLIYNPIVYILFSITGPFFLVFNSCRFVVKMFGYTIMALILNADIMAPVATFFVTVTKYLDDCYLIRQNKYTKVKEIISQEWQRKIKDLAKHLEKPKVQNDTIPKKLFSYVCNESKVLPVENEAFLMLRDMAIIFFSAFLALCAIFFATDSYKISTVASTIAVFVSGKIPMLLLRGTDSFNGWEKIKTKRKIREAVEKFVDQKRWLEPAMDQGQALKF